MKTYSNDPQEYDLYDYYNDMFSDLSMEELKLEAMSYIAIPHVMGEFNEWWVEQMVMRHLRKDSD